MTESPNLPLPGPAMQAAFEAEQEASEANRIAREKKAEKERTRLIAEAALEAVGLRSGAIEHEDGSSTQYYQVHKPKFDIIDPAKVREWAVDEDETYVDPEPALRESLVFQECRRRHEEGLPLPPGIAVRTETEFHKKTLPATRKA